MHEYSLVRALLSQIREAAGPYPDAAVDEVVVAIGPLSGVEPLLVASAFECLVRDTPFQAARLVIEHTPLRLACQVCGNEYETSDVAFQCPSCLSVRTKVLAGDEVVLRRLMLCDLEPQEAAT
jgi:hydrogenase nickel incorporation protein HypA/HybF